MRDGRLGVLQLISDLEIGGAQEVVRTLVEHLAMGGCQPIVGAFRDGPLRREIERLGITVVILPERRDGILNPPLFLLEMLRIRRSLLEIVRKYEIAVVQTHLLRSLDFLVLTLGLGRSLPIVFWTAHNSRLALRADQVPLSRLLLGPKRFGYWLLYRLTQRWVSGLVAISAEVATAIEREAGGRRDRISVINNGVDPRRYGHLVDRAQLREEIGLPLDAFLAITVATFKEQKGHRYLLEAARSLVEHQPRLHLLFVGDGGLREELRSQARNLGIASHVHFLGSRQDVPDLLAASDVFVLPSLWEGLSMALIEAMASRLPIVATAVSGTRQVVVSGETGVLVAPGDAAQLEQAIAYVLATPDRAREMGAAARARVEADFSAMKQAQDHIALYRQALSELPSRGRLAAGAGL